MRPANRPWKPGDDRRLTEMYRENTPAGAIGKLLGRTTTAIHKRAFRLGLSDPARQQEAVKRLYRTQQAYLAGCTRRRQGGRKAPPAIQSAVNRAWWLAGWHDEDMAQGVSVLEVQS